MASTIKIKNSSTAGAVPGTGDLVQGELAINVTDRRIFTENASGAVVELGTPSIDDNGNATAITIDSSENVGIGVAPSGTWKLDVAGYVKSAATAGGLYDAVYTGTTTGSTLGQLRFNGSGSGVTGESKIVGALNSGSITSSYLGFHTTASGSENEVMRLDSAGNLGLGVSPSAWTTASSTKALELTNGVSLSSYAGAAGLYQNAYVAAATAYTYKSTAAASAYQQAAGAHYWLSAASGTAGNAITFTQAMTLDASGKLGVGATSLNNKFVVSNSGAAGLEINPTLRDGTTVGSFLLSYNRSGAAFTPLEYDASYHAWLTSGTERARIDSSGNLGIGTTSADSRLRVLDSTAGAGLRIAYNGTSVNYYDADTHSFRNGASTERARIDSSGNLLVGTTSNPGGPGRIGVDFDSSANFGISMKSTNGSNNGVYARFFNSSAAQAGQIVQSGATTVSYTTSSDYRLKENIAPMVGALAVVAALKPCTYTWKVDGSDGQGFIAHELQAVVPDAVVGEKDAIDADGNPEYQGIDTSFLVATLTAAIQELDAKFEAYKATHP